MIIKKIKHLPSPLQYILELSSKLAQSLNYRIYLVGGIVRDLILGRENLDLDIVVEPEAIGFVKVLADKLKVKFRKHHSFGTATIFFSGFRIDFATARKESYARGGALPSVVFATLREDLARRDFTINTMAISLNRDDYGQLIDYYNGYQDLKNGIIRVLHKKSFLDDPTRILRAIKFEVRFSFRLERGTLKLLKEAVELGALSWVSAHRIKDELVSILNEEEPYKYIRRIASLVGFRFIHKDLVMKKEDFYLLQRIKNSILLYRQRFSHYRRIEEWLLYLMGIIHKLKYKELVDFSSRFALRRGQRIIILSILEYRKKVQFLNKRDISRVRLFKLLKNLSFEAIVFFYAYFKDKRIRRNLLCFLDDLAGISLKIKGKDLKEMGIAEERVYSKILEILLYRKIEKNLVTKKEELEELKKIQRYLPKLSPRR